MHRSKVLARDMIAGRTGEHSKKVESSKPTEEEANEVPNLKLLHRDTGNPERDKSYGPSSDEETTSSSLIPIPDSLRQMRKELKKKISDIGEGSEMESSYTVCSVFEKTGRFKNSLDKLRQMYDLHNEAAVTMKMNSANRMLDDILRNNNLNPAPIEYHQSKHFSDRENTVKSSHENSPSTTEGSVMSEKHCRHVSQMMAHSHLPISFEFAPHLCTMHDNTYQTRCCCSNSSETGIQAPDKSPEENPKRKSFVEKIQNLHIKYRINSLYRKIQNSYSLVKGRKESECVNVQQQGIPTSLYRRDSVLKGDSGDCKCEAVSCPSNQYSKVDVVEARMMSMIHYGTLLIKMICTLVEPSEGFQSESRSTDREGLQCTCFTHKECTCSEFVCKGVSAMCTCETSEMNFVSSTKRNLNFETSQKIHKIEREAKPADNSPTIVLTKGEDSGVSSSSDESYSSNKQFKKDIQESRKKRSKCKDRKIIERTDIYYFDHGNSAYYRTTDNCPVRYTDCLVERTDEYATKFWAEIFGSLGIGIAFIISFILQFYRFFFTSIIRPLTVGLLQISSDYFFKPLLTIVFNGLIQPWLILAYNIATSLRDLCLPVSQIFGFFAKEVANIVRSCRLVEVNRDKQLSCHCGNKV